MAYQVPQLGQLTPYHQFDPSGRESVRTMRFHGSQRLNLLRPTRLPAASRKYSRGDPVNFIDWRAFARTEQLVIREHFDEASFRIKIVLEALPHMHWPDTKILALSQSSVCTKLECGWRIALHFAYQYCRAGDQISLYLRKEEGLFQLQARTPTELSMAFETMLKLRFQAEDGLEMRPKNSASFLQDRSDLLLWISDGFQGVPLEIAQAKARKKSWIHVLSSLETQVDWLTLDDSYFDEDSQGQEYLGEALKQDRALEKALQKWLISVQKDWQKIGDRYLQVTDASPMQKYLHFLEQSWRHNPVAASP